MKRVSIVCLGVLVASTAHAQVDDYVRKQCTLLFATSVPKIDGLKLGDSASVQPFRKIQLGDHTLDLLLVKVPGKLFGEDVTLSATCVPPDGYGDGPRLGSKPSIDPPQ